MQLSDFVTYVKQDFKREDKDTEIIQAYNDMVNWVSVVIPHAGYKYQSYINTTVGVEDYALPENLIHLIKPIRLLLGTGAGDSGYELDDITKQEYDFREPNPNRSVVPMGRPSAACIFSRSILLTPIPDLATYLIEINWTKRRTVLSLDAETTNLGSEWDEVLKHGVLERVMAGLGLYEESQFWGSKYHQSNNGVDMPVGLCGLLVQIERDREFSAVGRIRNNSF